MYLIMYNNCETTVEHMTNILLNIRNGTEM